jgi:catechol 2,3-dioxygenase-like lactoylglutathione lyase family enzyme
LNGSAAGLVGRKDEPMELNQVTLPALDVAASVAFYQKMGFVLIVDSPHYARFEASPGGVTFSVHAVEALAEPPQTVVYFECESLDQEVADLQAKGVRFTQLPRDERWLWREARLIDPSGNVLCLYHAGENRLNPPWRVRP